MTSKELIKEYFKGGNAINIPYSAIKEALKAIKEISGELDKEMDEESRETKVSKPDQRNPAR